MLPEQSIAPADNHRPTHTHVTRTIHAVQTSTRLFAFEHENVFNNLAYFF